MTAVPFTPEQAAKLAEFDAAPLLPESSPMTRAMLAFAEELDGLVDDETVDETARIAHAWTATQLRRRLAAVLAADPEPRDAVIERMARAMWEDERGSLALDWAEIVESARVEYRRRSAVALDASRGATQ